MGVSSFGRLGLNLLQEHEFEAAAAPAFLPSTGDGLAAATGVGAGLLHADGFVRASLGQENFAGEATLYFRSDVAPGEIGGSVQLFTVEPAPAPGPCACCGGVFSHTGGGALSDSGAAGATYLNFDQRGGTGDNNKTSFTVQEAATQPKK